MKNCKSSLKDMVVQMRRLSVADLNTLHRNKRFLSKLQHLALTIVNDERAHRMGGN